MNVDKIRGGLIPVWYTVPVFKRHNQQSFHSYRRKVKRLTEMVKHEIPNIELRGWNTYHIDHIFSIYKGWISGVPEESIAHLSNLRLIPSEQNLKKGPFGE